jgi:hypothetical protein
MAYVQVKKGTEAQPGVTDYDEVKQMFKVT